MHMYTVHECLSVCVNFKACYSERTPLASLAPLLGGHYAQALGDLKKHEKNNSIFAVFCRVCIELEHVEVFWKQVGAPASIWKHLGASGVI